MAKKKRKEREEPKSRKDEMKEIRAADLEKGAEAEFVVVSTDNRAPCLLNCFNRSPGKRSK